MPISLQCGFMSVATSSSTSSAPGFIRFTFARTVEMPPALVSYFAAYSSAFDSGTSPPSPCFSTWLRQIATRWALFSRSKHIE